MSIKSEVLKAIEARIDEAQDLCDTEIAVLKSEKWESLFRSFGELVEQIKRIYRLFNSTKAEIEARHVNGILSKIM